MFSIKTTSWAHGPRKSCIRPETKVLTLHTTTRHIYSRYQKTLPNRTCIAQLHHPGATENFIWVITYY